MPYSHPQSWDRKQLFERIRHLVPGAVAFAAMAGFINSVVLGFFHSPVSHMTGAVSHFGIDLAQEDFGNAAASGSIIVGFVLGSILAGAMVGGRNLLPGRRYGAALIIEGCLLLGAVVLLEMRHWIGLPLVSMACGLQNATTSSYCGLMIRSTHVTGMVTDIGVMLGHWIRHRQLQSWKLYFLCVCFAAFGLGGWIGALLNQHFGLRSLLLPAIACLLAGWGVWIAVRRGWLKLPAESVTALPVTASFPEG